MKICQCGDHTPNKNGICWICESLNEVRASSLEGLKSDKEIRKDERQKIIEIVKSVKNWSDDCPFKKEVIAKIKELK